MSWQTALEPMDDWINAHLHFPILSQTSVKGSSWDVSAGWGCCGERCLGVPAMYSEADRQKFCSYCLVAKSCMTLLWPPWTIASRVPCPWNSPDKNTGVDSHFPLQGIFLTEGLKPHLLPWKVESLPLSQQGRPRQKVVLQELMQQNSHQPWTFQDLFLQLNYNCVNLITFLFFFF